MPAIALLTVWLGLPIAISSVLRRKLVPSVAVTAAVFASGLAVSGYLARRVAFQTVSPSNANQVYQDTYHVVAHAQFLLSLAGLYAVIAPLIALASTTASGRIRFMIPVAFWIAHLGFSTLALQTLFSQVVMPRRCVD